MRKEYLDFFEGLDCFFSRLGIKTTDLSTRATIASTVFKAYALGTESILDTKEFDELCTMYTAYGIDAIKRELAKKE